jgi:pantoate--beta-alanine ligase
MHILKGFDDIAEGRVRPGHFRGVATIVTKLFNIVQPTTAYFGQKDAAQCVMIRRLVEDLDMDINVVIKDTVREADGLAMSSRNAYLTAEERRAASVVFRSLCAARTLFDLLPEEEFISCDQLRERVEAMLRSEPLVSEIQYVAVDCKATMRPIALVDKKVGAIISLACKVGDVRLIDNIIL